MEEKRNEFPSKANPKPRTITVKGKKKSIELDEYITMCIICIKCYNSGGQIYNSMLFLFPVTIDLLFSVAWPCTRPVHGRVHSPYTAVYTVVYI